MDMLETGRSARLLTRRSLMAAAALLPGLALADPKPDPLGFVPDPAYLAKARALLMRVGGAADLHAHPGRFFAQGGDASPIPTVPDRVVADMREGLVTVASFAAVADASVLVATPKGMTVGRDFKPGEALADYRRQIANLTAAAKARGIVLLRGPNDLKPLVAGLDVGAFLTVEGGDFLEDDPGRVAAAFDDGVRCIVLVHYRPNALGDNQTSPPAHGGLTPLGGEVVKQMNRLGMLVDVAHAAETTVRQVLERSTAPVLCSHTVIKGGGYDHPRFLGAETAKAVAAAGGVIGAWPSGFGATTMAAFVDRVFRLAEVVGPDHAALGTDMDGNYMPVLSRYSQVPLLVGEMLRRGYGEAEAEKFVAGNFRRVWGQVWRG